MSFSSLIFIALFLPVFMIASVLVRGNQRKNLVLLLFSLIFYAFAGLTKLALLLLIYHAVGLFDFALVKGFAGMLLETETFSGNDDFVSFFIDRTEDIVVKNFFDLHIPCPFCLSIGKKINHPYTAIFSIR